ncbi:hypothetical protein MRX96_000708 [Rhipicephalus microplus]
MASSFHIEARPTVLSHGATASRAACTHSFPAIKRCGAGRAKRGSPVVPSHVPWVPACSAGCLRFPSGGAAATGERSSGTWLSDAWEGDRRRGRRVIAVDTRVTSRNAHVEPQHRARTHPPHPGDPRAPKAH